MRVLGFMLSATVVVAQEVDDTAYLLQTRTQQQKSGDVEDCYVTGGCSTTAATEAPTTTTTEAPTTTTARPTRPATTTPRPTRPTRPTTTTTTTPNPPPVGMNIEEQPGKKTSYDLYCKTGTKLKLTNPFSNNLGGMGPTTTDAEEMRYKNVATVNGSAVNLVITTDGTYYAKNSVKTFRSGSYTQTGQSFISKYNGGGPLGRSDVMAIGSLDKGAYTFTFKFENDAGEAVVIDYLPMTFFDLDGSTRVRGKSYEEVESDEAESILYVDGSHVKHTCDPAPCKAQGAKVEVEIPGNFDHLTPATKRAAVTFFFEGKSTFDIKYTLNYDHRVFLFKGQCIM